MRKENKIWNVMILITIVLSMVFTSGFVSAGPFDKVQNQATISILDSVMGGLGKGVTKLVGASPIVHGLIGGVFSGFNTYSKLNKEINFELTKDKVNISNDIKDYIDPENLDSSDYKEYGDQLYENRIMSPTNLDNQESVTGNRSTDNLDLEGLYKTMVLTDKNTLDTEFIQTIGLEKLYEKETAPNFRLEETTEELLVYDLDNNSVDAQKRAILFEDPNKTISNSYEYRNLVIKYPEANYDDKEEIKISLSTKDLLNGKLLNFLISPLSTGKNLLSLDKVIENKKLKEEIKKARDELNFRIQPFHLMFNSWTEDLESALELDQLDCIDEGGLALGTTGQEILPKVAFDWDFKSGTATAINGNVVNRNKWCDVSLEELRNTSAAGVQTNTGIYCDATQFTIELLSKVKKIKEYVNQHSSQFICPTPGVEREIITNVNNIGISMLNSSYDGINTVTVEYKIEGDFNVPGPNINLIAELSLNLINNTDSFQKYTPKITQINADDFIDNVITVTTEFTGIGYFPEPNEFTVNANIININGMYSMDLPGDNQLSNSFSTEAVECAYDHTSQNIKYFAKDIGTKFNDDKLVNFRSLLMKDGYSNDFKADFDDYYRTTFTGTPTWYYDEVTYEGLYKYFIDQDKFTYVTSFNSEPGQLVLPGPGRYEVQLNITFDDQWRVFDDAGNLVGEIEIYLTKELPPERDAPVYYMPFDGLVGITSPNARQGYGVDYIGDVIDLDHDILGTSMRSEPFTSSNTINTLNVKEYGNNPNDFAFMNNNQTRGMLMSITTSSTHTNPELSYVPSRATPVIMKVSNQENDAYAFYKLSVGNPEEFGGEAAHPGMNLTKWTGMGECKDFTGIAVTEAFLNLSDILATESSLAPYTPSQTFVYGMEWPEEYNIRRGNVFLRTVLYTPSNFTTGTGMSELYADSYSDDVMFYAPDNQEGKKIELHNVFSNDIKSLREMYGLVSEKKACINYSSTNLEVYYNPNAIISEFIGDTDSAVQNKWVADNGGCIDPSSSTKPLGNLETQ